jgi:hypothetical protein
MKASRHAWLFCMLLFYTALLMWNIFTKLLATFFSMPRVLCKNNDNEHTLLKCRFDKLNYSDANQGIVSLSTFYHLAIIETKIVYEICSLNVRCCLIKHHVKFPSKYHTTISWDKPNTVPQIAQ